MTNKEFDKDGFIRNVNRLENLYPLDTKVFSNYYTWTHGKVVGYDGENDRLYVQIYASINGISDIGRIAYAMMGKVEKL